MYDRRFFASKVGFSALVSVIAMITFNVYALNQQIALAPPAGSVALGHLVELA
ncbi:MAG: hypothetical protein ABIT09_10950 [Croceibacterium sp.]